EAGHAREALAELERGVEAWPQDEVLFDNLARLRLAGQPPEVVVEEFEVLLAMPSRASSLRLRGTFARALRAAGHLE
ncbi:hypothetical protein NL533_36275, partial [Klebsiella pneumoniae]|nr:hypothetical protein [Klebsiella pneumoniae]